VSPTENSYAQKVRAEIEKSAKCDTRTSQTRSMIAMSVSGTLRPSGCKSWQTRCELTLHNGHARLSFNIRAVVALCSSPEIHCNKGRYIARKSHRPTGVGRSNCRTRTGRDLPDRNG